MGRPLLEIDEKIVEELAAICCSMTEIADVVGCSVDTLERRFADVIDKGRSRGKTILRRKQWQAAIEKENIVMLIWLGKQLLGQSERTKFDLAEIPDEVLAEEAIKRIEEKRKKLTSGSGEST